MLVELNLMKIKYGILRQALMHKNIDVFPSNHLLVEESAFLLILKLILINHVYHAEENTSLELVKKLGYIFVR